MPARRFGRTVSPMMRDVMICCAPADELAGRKVCEVLEGEKISCWMAARDLAAGEDAQAMTVEAIESCPIMLLIFSQSANASDEVQDQVERAVRSDKILIPLRIENVAPEGRLEDSLRHRYRHDAFGGPIERHLPEVVTMLKPLLHRLVVRTREATSISRTLPSRSSIVRGLNWRSIFLIRFLPGTPRSSMFGFAAARANWPAGRS
jgi:hypothetical protein